MVCQEVRDRVDLCEPGTDEGKDRETFQIHPERLCDGEHRFNFFKSNQYSLSEMDRKL